MKALNENDIWFGAGGKNVAHPYNSRASLSPEGYDPPQILTGLGVKDVLYMPTMLARWVTDPTWLAVIVLVGFNSYRKVREVR